MRETDKITYYGITTSIAAILIISLDIILGGWGLFLGFILAVVLFITASNDTAQVPINRKMLYKDRWTGKLVGELNTGFYWTCFFHYELTKDAPIDSTVNEYMETVTTRSKNRITVTVSGSLWTPILDAVKYKEFGIDDAEQNVRRDWNNTLKAIVQKYDDEELDKMQNKQLKEEDFDNDTLKTTLKNCGMESEYNNLRIDFGTVQLPKEVEQAYSKLSIAEKVADADDFNNYEISKRVNTILLAKILSFLPAEEQHTVDSLKQEAIQSLGLNSNSKLKHEDLVKIYDKAVAIARSKSINLPSEVFDKMKDDVELKLNIRENRTKDINLRGGGGNVLLNETMK